MDERTAIGVIWCALMGWTCLGCAVTHLLFGVAVILFCCNRPSAWSLVPPLVLCVVGAAAAFFTLWLPALLIGVIYVVMGAAMGDLELLWYVLILVFCVTFSSLSRMTNLYNI
jgi:hypothetical protein